MNTVGKEIKFRQRTGCDRLLQVLNCTFLAVEMLTLRMVKPSQLLKNLGVVRVTIKDPVVSELRVFKLQ